MRATLQYLCVSQLQGEVHVAAEFVVSRQLQQHQAAAAAATMTSEGWTMCAGAL
jgi:hypothetical protein